LLPKPRLLVPPSIAILAQPPSFDPTCLKVRFAGYNKLLSMIYLLALGKPMLEGLVVEDWSDDGEAFIKAFCAERGWRELMLRHDRRNETPKSPRGGYTFPLSQLRLELDRFFREDRIVILFEPKSPYDDVYSVNVLFQDDGDTAIAEIVGPGFDASDLQRGDISPHEHITLRANGFAGGIRTAIVDRTWVSDSEYRAGVQARLVKIAKRHGLPPEERAGRNFLESTGHTVLLTHLDSYVPIPDHFLSRIFAELTDLPEALTRVSGNRGACVVSMSFLGEDRLTFWDVVWPRLKYYL